MTIFKIRTNLLTFILVISATITGAAQNGIKTEQKQKQQKLSSGLAKATKQTEKEFIKTSEEYRNSLKELLSSYERESERLSAENTKLKELYAEGLIARREVEASDDSITQAKAKIEGVQKQISDAENIIEAAKKPPVTTAQPNIIVRNGSEMAWSTGSQRIDNLIRYHGKQYDVDPYLIYCVMHQESGFNSGATSVKGAQGLMQLMPGTAARYGVTNSYDASQNIMGGTRYLKYLLGLFGGRIDLVLAGYNAGEGAVMKYGYRVPPYAETKAYVRTISARYMKNNGLAYNIKT